MASILSNYWKNSNSQVGHTISFSKANSAVNYETKYLSFQLTLRKQNENMKEKLKWLMVLKTTFASLSKREKEVLTSPYTLCTTSIGLTIIRSLPLEDSFFLLGWLKKVAFLILGGISSVQIVYQKNRRIKTLDIFLEKVRLYGNLGIIWGA